MPFTGVLEEVPNSKPLQFIGWTPGQPAWNYPRFHRKRGTIYVMECHGFTKIGVTRGNEAAQRLRTIQTTNPLPVHLRAYRTVPLAGMAYGEAYLHKLFAGRRMHNEWFSVDWEEVVPLLPKAVVRAETYDRYCREWDARARFEQRERRLAEAQEARGEAKR